MTPRDFAWDDGPVGIGKQLMKTFLCHALDHKQLGPHMVYSDKDVHEKEIERGLLSSYLEDILEKGRAVNIQKVTILFQTMRCNPVLAAVWSKAFYSNQMTSHPGVQDETLPVPKAVMDNTRTITNLGRWKGGDAEQKHEELPATGTALEAKGDTQPYPGDSRKSRYIASKESPALMHYILFNISRPW